MNFENFENKKVIIVSIIIIILFLLIFVNVCVVCVKREKYHKDKKFINPSIIKSKLSKTKKKINNVQPSQPFMSIDSLQIPNNNIRNMTSPTPSILYCIQPNEDEINKFYSTLNNYVYTQEDACREKARQQRFYMFL